jgi:hypothetical protein
MNGISIKIQGSKPKQRQIQRPHIDNHIEVSVKNLKYFLGLWVKVINKTNGNYDSGGFLAKVNNDTIHLKTIKDPDVVFDVKTHIFYVKKEYPQYIAMQEIILKQEKLYHLQNKFENEKSKFEIEKKIFDLDKEKFLIMKDKFLNLVQDGKVKIFL